MCRIKHISHTQERPTNLPNVTPKPDGRLFANHRLPLLYQKSVFFFQSTMHTHSHICTHMHTYTHMKRAAATATTTGTTLNGWMKWFQSKIWYSLPIEILNFNLQISNSSFFLFIDLSREKYLRTFVATHYIWFHFQYEFI